VARLDPVDAVALFGPGGADGPGAGAARARGGDVAEQPRAAGRLDAADDHHRPGIERRVYLRGKHRALSYSAHREALGLRRVPSAVSPPWFRPAVAPQLPEPIQFGKYTLFERIGRGGMAEVYKGRIQGPAGFERVFVVKRILPHLSEEPTFIHMYVEEAKLSARPNHPNIVQIFELGNVEGEYFISMEYIRGRDLADTMRAIWKTMGPPRPELVAYVGREACRALAYARSLTDDSGHPLGMIHRDVSPSNIMLSYEGGVK